MTILVLLWSLFYSDEDMKVDEAVLKKALSFDHFTEEEIKQIRDAGGYSEAALPVYMKWLKTDPPLHWSPLSRILGFLQKCEGDLSDFRGPVVKLLTHEEIAVSRNAVRLLKQIGTEEDAAAVASQLGRITNSVAYYNALVDTLSVIGSEKEIETLEAERKAGLLPEHPRFWEKVDACEKTIRERAAKKKDAKGKK